MTAAQEVTVREAARRAGRSEETIRRWIWTGRLPAVKRGTSYRIDMVHLEEIIVELATGVPAHGAEPNVEMREWLDELREWKRSIPTVPGATASEMLLEDRRARR